MTLKQFFQLAGGTLIALLFYASPLPSFLKWPFIIFFALAGAALAFLPLQERPLEQWVIAFFRSVYSPTRFVWQKRHEPVQYFQGVGSLQTATTSGTSEISEAEANTVTIKPGFMQNLEEAEKQFLTTFTGLFSLGENVQDNQVEIGTPHQTPAKEELAIPRQVAVEVKSEDKGFNKQTPEPGAILTQETLSEILPRGQSTTQTFAAQFSPDAAPPMPPTQPNVIVGQVMDANKNIIEGAILEIKDPMNRPVRALKTNKAGHFLIVTPLNKGTYTIEIEKEGFCFDPITLEAKGEIIPPIAIQAKKETT